MGFTAKGMDLRELRNRLRVLTSHGFKTDVSQVLGATAMKLVADEFLGSRDPYGDPWKSLVARVGKPLLRTGRMRNSVAVTQTGGGFIIRVTASYSRFHQYGTRAHKRGGAIPRRQMLPERTTGGLGPIWVRAFNREAASLINRRLREAA